MRHPTTALDRAAHCRRPEVCAVEGAGLCASCIGVLHMARINADPAIVARRKENSAAARRSEEYRMGLRERLRQNRKTRKWRDATADAGRRSMAVLNADPAIIAKRARSVSITRTRMYAERVGVPLELIDAFRALRERKFQIDEARSILARSHPLAFRETVQRAAPVRSTRPQPAPGMPERREWIRKAMEARA